MLGEVDGTTSGGYAVTRTSIGNASLKAWTETGTSNVHSCCIRSSSALRTHASVVPPAVASVASPIEVTVTAVSDMASDSQVNSLPMSN